MDQKELIIFTDGASRGNPGKASYAFVIFDSLSNLIYKDCRYIGITTNNMAEYTAVLEALNWLKNNIENPIEWKINFMSDSQLLIRQLLGEYKVKNIKIREIYTKIMKSVLTFGQVSFTHIFRDKNTLADKLANDALDNL